MSTAGVMAPAPAPKRVILSNRLLQGGGYFSLAFAVFQVTAIWWPASTIQYFGGPARLSVERPIIYAVLCLGAAAILVLFGLYALSGAGQIRRLPLLRTALIAATAIYLLRGLVLIPQMPLVLKHPEFFRFALFSLVSLCVAIAHAGGVLLLCRHGRPGE